MIPNRRQFLPLAVVVFVLSLTFLLLRSENVRHHVLQPHWDGTGDDGPKPKYKPEPTYTPPPIKDPFPQLGDPLASLPTVPTWNAPRPGLHGDYGLVAGPPLLIGFTRTWPLLLQAVVSYIAAGWPPEQIYVVENTGVQQANARGQLTLQNPFYLDHARLKRLGVNVVQTPVLLNFAQLQNFYVNVAHAHGWEQYFWSHMDVLALGYEDGFEGLTGPAHDVSSGDGDKANSPGYRSLYELCCYHLAETLRGVSATEQDPETGRPRWGIRFFAYDHLALVNRRAYEAVGGWDTLIPYYMTDCDMHTRLGMANWSIEDATTGIITDVASALDDLRSLYRVPGIEPTWTDPNPPPPPSPGDEVKERGDKEARAMNNKTRRRRRRRDQESGDAETAPETATSARSESAEAEARRFRALVDTSNAMFHYKHGGRGRNTWQAGQMGGLGEPFYYDAAGLAEGIDVLTEAGREVFRRKWGHRDCNLVGGAGLRAGDAWRVEKDWE